MITGNLFDDLSAAVILLKRYIVPQVIQQLRRLEQALDQHFDLRTIDVVIDLVRRRELRTRNGIQRLQRALDALSSSTLLSGLRSSCSLPAALR